MSLLQNRPETQWHSKQLYQSHHSFWWLSEAILLSSTSINPVCQPIQNKKLLTKGNIVNMINETCQLAPQASVWKCSSVFSAITLCIFIPDTVHTCCTNYTTSQLSYPRNIKKPVALSLVFHNWLVDFSSRGRTFLVWLDSLQKIRRWCGKHKSFWYPLAHLQTARLAICYFAYQ